ncbi:16S rRNA (adenine(1518)-N(6)/adenine(1519)-N(6))-dimethyltransferase RsmA [Sneathiella glossodoripedis]|uniref:16S rRNA (adenine(1518)-N(6)/adenine(1519)-N(6))- dimethyltransferase RsmA n=1 Tax=Sneathiella glossodoripedis TaxID=418853 RepID=UPI00046E8B20|nr:16S rRNA (adenine(1518)-N(6)/adenine(1519)-N(6))-dimethyltransferase RsmA [Sneathiella glossodoripedis]
MSDGSSLPPLRDVINTYGLRAEKSLGQNFLLDLNLTGRIARCPGNLQGETVLEIGPGPGGLTRAILAAGAKRLVAIEKDTRCLAALEEVSKAFENRLTVHNEDALEIDEAELVGEKAHIIANLPYNVATPLLIKWLKKREDFKSMTLMFQKEVADRITAEPRTKAYGRLSIISQWLCHVSRQFDISPKAFTPPPKVVSTVVKLVPRDQPAFPADLNTLERVVGAAFGQRRKMLRASLKSLGGNAEEILNSAGILPTKRAEELSVEEFCRLSEVYRTR